MTAPTHAVGGIAAYSLFSLLLPTLHLDPPTVITAGVFAILPDMDNPRSFIGRLLFFFSGPLDRHFGHRTISHSLLFCVFISIMYATLSAVVVGGFLAAAPLFFAAFMGFFSHIMLDSMTKQGTLFFYPSKIWCVLPRRASWRIRTGHPFELLFFISLSLACAGLISAQRQGIYSMFEKFFTYTGVEAKIAEFEQKKKAVSHGKNPDSLFNSGLIDRKEYSEMQTAIEKIELEKKQYMLEQGLIRDEQ